MLFTLISHSNASGPRRLCALVDCCRSWSPSAPSAGSYACLVIVAPRTRPYDELPVRAVSAPLRILPVCFSYAIKDGAPPSVLLLEPSPLRHAIAIHLIRISATFLASSITITATCTLCSTRPVPDVGDHIVAVVASPSIQCCWLVLVPSINMTSDADKIPRPSDSALALEPSLRPVPVGGIRMDVLLVTHVCARSEWRGQCTGDATRCGDDDVRARGMDGRTGGTREEVREEIMRRMDAAVARGAASEVEAVRPGIEVGATVRASRAYATTRKSPRKSTRKSPRSGVVSLRLAMSLAITRTVDGEACEGM
ncbi:hypothetical protein DFH08DRAFT_1076384 [Mycena albidolilacea]|uniref:Uncharacterized protein n=1 Tax=Mycena albidolilacea TaxID=1033008 RepID=A0AAD7ADD3_9AGAR|nr:hypothetical protein DFH08DRAFT_1076384 [Mycena albidolilacea]